MLIAFLLIMANVLGVGMIVPQVLRLHRNRADFGVSGAGAGVGIVMNLWWTMYGVQGQLWGIVPVSVLGFALYVIMATQLIKIGGRNALRSIAGGFATLGFLPLPFLVLDGWQAAGVAIGFCYGLQFSPAAYTALRSSNIADISPTTWAMAWVEAAIWFIYGMTISDSALLVGGGGGAFMASVILGRLAYVHRRPSQLMVMAK